ncbi:MULTISPECIES: sce7726 family protein [unclassified Acinetobacter]|uniref:sce7726 family protein n=1 Tax=unclassified Acinetobacter TaxID=196816 RepID=UPI00244AE2BD|nr:MULTISPECIES: sce7726 family protein [unclassified Acinetobacter]MDH0031520.1 sce7726 family protein [Acinetobacter sp. GD04021]MDH0886863.1 sce7726 family protein [Acinetobacter sp. GD03873]MDH1083324.1 sce7726 family protein [Acinetobacter sp. GD03983]MDH2190179.1 sce7726 family protein [Acinetobacter sp. GD03645]MDH2203342.1 sce7726 family protein [Acinetobacter sp. GD03647]
MQILNDAEIRTCLVNWLNQKKVSPQHILNELSISDGLARPDLIAIYSYSHCYEIKGDNDQIERIAKQYDHYQSSFKKNTLVTTAKNLEKALNILPSTWGIVIASIKNNTVKFKYVRKATYNPNYKKEIASKILWKNEMQALLKQKNISYYSKATRFDLIDLITESYTSLDLDKNICNILLNREVSQHIGHM